MTIARCIFHRGDLRDGTAFNDSARRRRRKFELLEDRVSGAARAARDTEEEVKGYTRGSCFLSSAARQP